mmetsp:Transcript_117180/g.202464  ORF Transcript_117180/g.202464 Transcript_117180/m.202464 type:complete len:403 (+) Transcript_117180:1-1209(+)
MGGEAYSSAYTASPASSPPPYDGHNRTQHENEEEIDAYVTESEPAEQGAADAAPLSSTSVMPPTSGEKISADEQGPDDLVSVPLIDDLVSVPRSLLREVIDDRSCPVHLRLQLLRYLSGEEESALEQVPGDEAPIDSEIVEEVAAGSERRHDPTTEARALASLNPGCLSAVAAYLPIAEILAVRTCSVEQLQWAMQRQAVKNGPRHLVHDRIRTRLWMQRIKDLTAGTKDESVFETGMRSLADEALRSRMEDEMQEALHHMEEQIQSFQAEVDRRLEEQERHVKRMVEERVQQELDAILVSEVAKVQAMVEERVRERVSTMFRREVRETVRELQVKLDALMEENQTLRDAFAEANLRCKSFFWVMHPPFFQTTLATGLSSGALCMLSLKRRAALASKGLPPV